MERFDFKRFVTYLQYELNNAKNNFGLTLLICGIMPAITYIMSGIFSSLLSGNWVTNAVPAQIVAFITASIALILNFPVKLYGGITEKRKGSNWLMIPASTFEKFLSMMLLTFVALPLCAAVLFFGTDFIMSLIVPSYNPITELSISNLFKDTAVDDMLKGIGYNGYVETYLQLTMNTLMFLLGSICFKSGKIGKTFLVIIGVSIAVSMIFGGIWGNMNFNEEYFETFANEPEDMYRMMRNIGYLTNTIIFLGLAGGIYYRIRTLKH